MILTVLVWFCVALAVAWLFLSIFNRWKRRTYNLTVAESGGAATKPDFLKIDRAKRQAALERGTATRIAAPPPTARWSRITGYAATVCAGLTLIVATLTALTSIEDYTEMAGTAANLVTDTEQFGTILREYWPGLLVAIAVIVVQAYRFLVTVRRA